MTIETKYGFGDRIRLKGSELGYAFMVGPVTGVQVFLDAEGGKRVSYRMEFEDAKRRSGWREWFTEDEVEPAPEPPKGRPPGPPDVPRRPGRWPEVA